jgi:hypothetical protein
LDNIIFPETVDAIILDTGLEMSVLNPTLFIPDGVRLIPEAELSRDRLLTVRIDEFIVDVLIKVSVLLVRVKKLGEGVLGIMSSFIVTPRVDAVKKVL